MSLEHPDTIKICIILHAHLPFVCDSSRDLPLEEIWLYQNIAECYIPLVMMCNSLLKKNIQPSIALSLSPTLITMLQQDYYKHRFKQWCLQLCEFSDILKKHNRKAVKALHFYDAFITDRLHYIENNDVLDELQYLACNNAVELLTTAATHPFMPLLRHFPYMMRLQIKLGIDTFYSRFGYKPDGFWLPEMGYCYGMDSYLIDENINYTIVNDKSILMSNAVPHYGNFFPSVTKSGLMILPRDTVLSMKIWSGQGYPGNPYYREFHRDALYELQELSPTPDNTLLGLKIYAVTGSDDKKYYNPDCIPEIVSKQVDDFIDTIYKRSEQVANITNKPPVFILPFDAELFGHWWFEGPLFLELLIEKIAQLHDVELIMPSDLLGSECATVDLVESSWGKQADFSTWYNPLVRRNAAMLDEIMYEFLQYVNLKNEMLYQCAREILLAMASDWLFMISTGSYTDYAGRRFSEHSDATRTLLTMLNNNESNETLIHERYKKYPIFPTIDRVLTQIEL